MVQMSSTQSVAPTEIVPNPENPRLIFREEELSELERSIVDQGILVPLTVYRRASDQQLVILDGERRWRCSRRIGLTSVPVIVQPEPTAIQNIMMMFAIHNTRREWDPLPTALKLAQLEGMYFEHEGKRPTEEQLAQLASISRGEVRRLKAILKLPQRYLDRLSEEGEKPRSDQVITVDHVLEATRGSEALVKRGIMDESMAAPLTDALVQKYQSRVLTNTVEPRLLARMARAVERGDVQPSAVRASVDRMIDDPTYSVNDAFQDTVQRADEIHSLDLQLARITESLTEYLASEAQLSRSSMELLKSLARVISEVLS